MKDKILFKKSCQIWHYKINNCNILKEAKDIRKYIETQLKAWLDTYKISTNKIILLEKELIKEKRKKEEIRNRIRMLEDLGIFTIKKEKILDKKVEE